MSVEIQNQTRKLGNNYWLQVVAALLAALMWIPYIYSALTYDEYWWMPIMFYSRIGCFILPIVVGMIIVYRKKVIPNFESLYYLLCMLLQTIPGSLEPSDSVEFFQYSSLFMFLSCSTFEGGRKQWLLLYLPAIIFAHAIPFSLKDPVYFNSLGEFNAKFSMNNGYIIFTFVLLSIQNRRLSFAQGALEVKNHYFDLEKKRSETFEQELEKAKKELEKQMEYVGIAKATQMVAHDVRKPFSMIKGAVQILENSENKQEIDRYLPKLKSNIENAVYSVEGMIQDILSIGNNSKISASKESLNKIIVKSLTEVAEVQKRGTINLNYELAHQSQILADANKIQRVFSNLLHNACQAMVSNGTITIKTIEGDGYITIAIRNSGSYIPPEKAKSIFDAFYTENRKGGTGLGLAVAKKFVGEHGGTIWLKSSKENQTVTFYVKLPVANGDLDPETEVNFVKHRLLSEFKFTKYATKVQQKRMSDLEKIKPDIK